MKCPKCGFENLDKAKFCHACGNKLEFLILIAGLEIHQAANFVR
jgi:hypothetical protein